MYEWYLFFDSSITAAAEDVAAEPDCNSSLDEFVLDDGWEDGAGERRAEVTPPEVAAAAVKGVRGDMGTPAGLKGEKGSVPWEAAAAWAAAAAAAADPAAAAAAAEGDQG